MSKDSGKYLTIGERLRRERLRVGLSQDGLARLVGISRQTQNNYEQGNTKPDAKYLEAIKLKKGIDPAYVLTGKKVELPDDELVAENAESLLLEMCELLRIPPELALGALLVTTPDDSHHISKGDIRDAASFLLKNSTVLNANRKQLELDRDMLVDIVEGVELQLRLLEKNTTALRKAHVIASLYRQFAEKGKLDPNFLEAAVKSMPGS